MTTHTVGVVIILWLLFSALFAAVWCSVSDFVRWLDTRKIRRLPLMDRIAADMAADLDAEWEEVDR